MPSREIQTSNKSLKSKKKQYPLQQFEETINEVLSQHGLPVEQLFVPLTERASMVGNIGAILGELDDEILRNSHYISKMVAASAVGLFDAALNYLWDELVAALRTRVAAYDLRYFFEIAAENNNDLKKTLKTEDDLQKIDDARLLKASLEIGVIDALGRARLDHIRFMRNHASAAHPNQNSLSGIELLSFLQQCIREVINKPISLVSANIRKLMFNIKKSRLSSNDVELASAFFGQLPNDRADTLANALFGLYTSTDLSAEASDNIRLLWPLLWPYVQEPTRNNFGLRHARAAASAETGYAAAARELIDLVNGSSYLMPEIRAVEISEALDLLRDAHFNHDNFYNEPAPARHLLSLIGPNGDVPIRVRLQYIETLVQSFLGNGYGVSTAAEPAYKAMLSRLTPQDAAIALRLFLNPEVASVLSTSSGQRQWEKLLDILQPKLISEDDRDLMQAILDFSSDASNLARDTNIMRLAKQ